MRVAKIEIVNIAGDDAPYPYNLVVMTTEDGRRFEVQGVNLHEQIGQVVERMEKPE